MKAKPGSEWIEWLEKTPFHVFSLQAWAWLLEICSPAHKTRRLPTPVVFTSHEHRLQVYTARVAAREQVFHWDDVQPEIMNEGEVYHEPEDADAEDEE